MVSLLSILFTDSLAYASDPIPEEAVVTTDMPAETDPKQPGENKKFKFLSKKPENLLLVPIPTSNPTFGTGLILGGAYFYKQTDEQKESQPASFTGVAAGYTDNESWFAGVMQQNYWKEDKWLILSITGFSSRCCLLMPIENAGSVTVSSKRKSRLGDGGFRNTSPSG